VDNEGSPAAVNLHSSKVQALQRSPKKETANPMNPREMSRALEMRKGESPDPLSPEDLLHRASEREQLMFRWQQQSGDERWSNAAEVAVQKLLADAKLDTGAVRDVDCRETICRFALVGRGGEEALDLIRTARRLDEQTWVDHHEHFDGTWTIEVFFPREGRQLAGNDEPLPKISTEGPLSTQGPG
jgi:hypothetical protein